MSLVDILNYKNDNVNQEIRELQHTNSYVVHNHNSFHNFNLILSKIFSFDWQDTNNTKMHSYVLSVFDHLSLKPVKSALDNYKLRMVKSIDKKKKIDYRTKICLLKKNHYTWCCDFLPDTIMLIDYDDVKRVIQKVIRGLKLSQEASRNEK